MTPTVRICGLGTRVPEETTLEALIALGECREAFCDVADARAFAWLKKRLPRLKRPKGAAEVAAAARRGGPVGLAVWGHPQFNSRLAREVEGLLRAEGIAFSVLGAISPVGAAFARSVSFLGGDYGYQGLQCLDLETLLADPGKLATRLPLVVCAEAAAPARWAALAEFLKTRYAPGHEVRAYPVGSDAELKATVGTLKTKGWKGATLLVPPEGGAPRRPHDMAG